MAAGGLAALPLRFRYSRSSAPFPVLASPCQQTASLTSLISLIRARALAFNKDYGSLKRSLAQQPSAYGSFGNAIRTSPSSSETPRPMSWAVPAQSERQLVSTL